MRPDAFHPLAEDRLARDQLVVLVQPRLDVVADDLDVVLPTVRKVGSSSPGPDEVVVHTEPGRLLEESKHELALSEAEDHHRGRAQVHPVSGKPHQMRRHALELGEQHSYPDRPGWELDAEELFGRHGEHELVVERRQVVHPSDVRRALDVGELFAGLLHSGVQVTDDGLRP